MIFLFRGIRDELIDSRMSAPLRILCNIIKFTNSLQTFLQAVRLNWCDIPRVLNTLKDNLQAKIENPAHLPTSYFTRVQEFIDIAKKSSGGRYQLRSYADFELSNFHANFVKPVISDLIGEIENAFDIPEHFAMPSNVITLENFGEQEIKSLACFYGSSNLISHGKKSVKPIVNYGFCSPALPLKMGGLNSKTFQHFWGQNFFLRYVGG